MSIFFPGSQDRKKHRKISETAALPTIPDEQHQEHPEPHKDAETESELEEDAVSYIAGQKIKKKIQAKKLVKSNKSFFSREIAFLAVLNFFLVQKLIFGHFCEID